MAIRPHPRFIERLVRILIGTHAIDLINVGDQAIVLINIGAHAIDLIDLYLYIYIFILIFSKYWRPGHINRGILSVYNLFSVIFSYK